MGRPSLNELTSVTPTTSATASASPSQCSSRSWSTLTSPRSHPHSAMAKAATAVHGVPSPGPGEVPLSAAHLLSGWPLDRPSGPSVGGDPTAHRAGYRSPTSFRSTVAQHHEPSQGARSTGLCPFCEAMLPYGSSLKDALTSPRRTERYIPTQDGSKIINGPGVRIGWADLGGTGPHPRPWSIRGGRRGNPGMRASTSRARFTPGEQRNALGARHEGSLARQT
jgi:hypothetical protein